MHDSIDYQLVTVEGTEEKTYWPPVYIDERNIDADSFIANFEKFLPLYIGRARPTEDTMATYETAIRIYLNWCKEARMHPFAVRDFQFRLYIAYMQDKQHLAPASVRLKIAAIRAFYHMSVKLGFIKSSPCDDIPLPPLDNLSDADFKYYTVEQLGEICNSFLQSDPLTCARNKFIVYLMGVEGLRTVEVMRLNDEDINFERKTILIRGKGNHNALIYPCDATMDVMMAYMNKRGQVDPEGEVTPTIISFSHRRIGKRITRSGLRKIVNTALEWAGVKYPGHACHTLRHSCGTNLYHETKDIRVVQETLRHKSPVMTARYSHVDERTSTRPTKNITPVSK